MMISNLDELNSTPKKISNTCHTNLAPDLRDCQNCRYRHKGICDEFFEQKFEISNRIMKNLEEGIEVMTNSRLEDLEPVLSLKDLFYEIKMDHNIEKMPEIMKQKAKYDNFKLLTDIQRVLQNCRHLTDKDRLNYCNTQRYFMKLYLREFNKPK
ncbi:MAG: hypothetical protein ACFFFT_08690 [Candidatus Thorarchaeota archaeon]